VRTLQAFADDDREAERAANLTTRDGLQLEPRETRRTGDEFGSSSDKAVVAADMSHAMSPSVAFRRTLFACPNLMQSR
jgi:hypothetical protein